MELHSINKQTAPMVPLNKVSPVNGNGLANSVNSTQIDSDEQAMVIKNSNTDASFAADKPHFPTVDPNGPAPEAGEVRVTSPGKHWRTLRTTIAANTAFQQAEREKRKRIHRQMYGSKAAIPVLPLPLAIVLLFFNCIIPGLGTVVSGFTFICCATTYDKQDRDELSLKIPGLVATNICVGMAQLLTITFLLVGWFWSISWGVTMVYLAIDRSKQRT